MSSKLDMFRYREKTVLSEFESLGEIKPSYSASNTKVHQNTFLYSSPSKSQMNLIT